MPWNLPVTDVWWGQAASPNFYKPLENPTITRAILPTDSIRTVSVAYKPVT